MGRYNDTSIKKLVNGINQEYFLPDIQRPFVWKNDKNEFEGKVCSLFDSILRNYPIGTLLFWKIDKKRADEDNLTLLKFLENSNTYRNDKFLSISSEKDYILVLDGQQRMTIFNLVFKGIFEDTFRNKIRRRNLYFNLLTDLDKNELIEENFYEFKFFEEEKKSFFKDGKNKIWYKIKDILSLKIEDLEDEFEKIYNYENDMTTENKKIIRKNLTKLLSSINEDNVSYYEIEKSKKDDEALEIFVRVNSKGVVLSYSDLLFSKIIQYWKNNEETESARDIFYQFLNGDDKKGEIKGINRYGDGFNFDNDFILKTSLVLIHKEIRYKIKNFNEENISLIKNNWSKITDSVRKVIKFLPKIGITSNKYLRSNLSIIPIIYFIYKKELYNKDIEDNANENQELYKKFIYIILLNGVFGGQSDQLLKSSRDEINKTESILFPANNLLKVLGSSKTIKKEDELKEFLDEISYNTDKSKIILKILYGNLMDDETQEDHLFPQKKTKKKYDIKLVDNIANLQALKSENQNKGGKDFEEWINLILTKIPDFKTKSFIPELDIIQKPDEELRSCGILNSYSEENFEVFLKRRRILIYRKIKDYFKF
ncbi:DUF262 domain-containing protein [Candidatus Woesearchaeota archaeon]|nr:MAG: PF03235 family protein [archaeon GW2011_AR18]MBS3162081.1 DUF262 domain-containing protein [Candidatus Woesearchaeota archaeon]HIH26017.1 DUF262 domain-containing protein [Nanoarchaeota archaeon]